ncbi:unnamed protein product [Callosobruchus maculatus]|uniref:Uncharacterized protein n=1 Tax=Callosobruchus maculatus TaxID=64391 RepID=A0A653D060_CALMS|nr:unnamed protein product [Callosobruchus maculatus]
MENVLVANKTEAMSTTLTSSVVSSMCDEELEDKSGRPADLEDKNHPDWVPSQNMRHTALKVLK